MKNKDFGLNLKKLRIAAGKSVSAVSSYLTALGIKASEKTIYSWESGRSQPTPDVLLDMCDYYNVSDILAAFGYKQEAPVESQSSFDNVYNDISVRAHSVAKAYDAQPEMQPAVDRLLGIEQVPAPAEEPYTKIKTAAYGGGVWEQPMTKEEYEKLRKIHDLPNDFR